MLRSTKSAIIFIQQLGRGLRKNNYKEYVVIIDFVGNYNSNFLIPIALSGDKTYNKYTIRKYVMEGNRIIPGCSTVNFDEISKKRIFESIDKVNFNDSTETYIINVLTNQFATGTGKETYKECIFLEQTDFDYKTSEIFIENLKNEELKKIVIELIEFGIYRYKKFYSNRYIDTSFQLYQKYTYEDVCRLLEWEKGEVALNIGGYKFDKKTKTYPVFINYNKSEDISDSIHYEDRFESSSQLIAISKSGIY